MRLLLRPSLRDRRSAVGCGEFECLRKGAESRAGVAAFTTCGAGRGDGDLLLDGAIVGVAGLF